MKKQLTAAVLCAALTIVSIASASAASYTNKTETITTPFEGGTLVCRATYPGIAGYIDANIEVEKSRYVDGELETLVESQRVKIAVMKHGSVIDIELLSGGTTPSRVEWERVYKRADTNSGSGNANISVGGGLMQMDGGYVMLINHDEFNQRKDAFVHFGLVPFIYGERPNHVIHETEVGLYDLQGVMLGFQSSSAPATPLSWSDYASVELGLGWCLVLPQAQIETLNFAKTYTTKELEALIKGDAPTAAPLLFQIDRYTPPFWVPQSGEDFLLATGASYAVTVTNPNPTAHRGHYALVSYSPRLSTGAGTERFSGQIHFFDVALTAQETKLFSFVSSFPNLASGEYRFVWLHFEDEAERKAFQDGVPFDSDIDHFLDQHIGADWMKTEFGIAIQK